MISFRLLPRKEGWTVDVVADIKEKTEKDFLSLLDKISKGNYNVSYDNIMDMIAFVEYYGYYPHPVEAYQKLMSL